VEWNKKQTSSSSPQRTLVQSRAKCRGTDPFQFLSRLCARSPIHKQQANPDRHAEVRVPLTNGDCNSKEIFDEQLLKMHFTKLRYELRYAPAKMSGVPDYQPRKTSAGLGRLAFIGYTHTRPDKLPALSRLRSTPLGRPTAWQHSSAHAAACSVASNLAKSMNLVASPFPARITLPQSRACHWQIHVRCSR